MVSRCQNTILLHKPYLVKWSTKGEEGQNVKKSLSTRFMDDPKREGAMYVSNSEMDFENPKFQNTALN